jgi:hypothetical protein
MSPFVPRTAGRLNVPVAGASARRALAAAPRAVQLRIMLEGGLIGTTTFDDVGLYDH